MRLCTSVSVQGECFKNPSTLPLKVKADPIILFQNALVTEKRNMSYTLLLLYHSWRIVERLTVGGIENSFAQSVVEHKHCCDTMARSINLQRLPQRRDNSKKGKVVGKVIAFPEQSHLTVAVVHWKCSHKIPFY